MSNLYGEKQLFRWPSPLWPFCVGCSLVFFCNRKINCKTKYIICVCLLIFSIELFKGEEKMYTLIPQLKNKEFKNKNPFMLVSIFIQTFVSHHRIHGEYHAFSVENYKRTLYFLLTYCKIPHAKRTILSKDLDRDHSTKWPTCSLFPQKLHHMKQLQ